MKIKYLTWIFVFLFLVVNVSAVTDSVPTMSSDTNGFISDTNGQRIKVISASNLLLENVTKSIGSTKTNAVVYFANKSVYKTIAFTGYSAYMNITLYSGETYFIIGQDGDANIRFNCGVTFPIVGINVNWTEGVGGGFVNISSDTCVRDILSITTSNVSTNLDNRFTFVPPSESGTTKYLPSTYILINVSTNISNFRNMTIYLYNSTGLYYFNFTTNSSKFLNITVPLINETYKYNVTARNTTNQYINSDTYVNYILGKQLTIQLFSYSNSPLGANVLNVTELNTSIKTTYYNVTNVTTITILDNYAYSITIDNSSQALQTNVYQSNTSNSQMVRYYLYPSNSINVTFYDALNNSRILAGLNISVTGTTLRNFSTSTGNILITDLSLGTNEIKANSNIYSESRYAFDVASRSWSNISLYLIPITSTNNVTFTFFDSNGALVENVYTEQYVLNNVSYVLTMSSNSNIVGKSYFTYNPSGLYKYTYSKSGYVTTSFILNPPRDSNYDIILVSSSAVINYNTVNVTGSYTYSNLTKILNFNYISTDTSLINYSYTVSKYIDGKYVVICYESSLLDSNTYSCNLAGYSGNIFIQGVVDEHIFYGTTFNIGNVNELWQNLDPKDAAFMSGIISLLVIMATIPLGVFGILGGSVVSLIVISWLNILSPINLIFIVASAIVSIVIAFGMRRN